MRHIVDIELTRRCNLSCSACFVRAQPEPEAELTTAQVIEVLDQLPLPACSVHLTGGEPFLHPGIWTILERSAAGRAASIVVNTNATLLAPHDLGRLGALGLPVLLLVSFDGPGEAHARSRGPGVAEAARAVLCAAPHHGVMASPASILTRELLDHDLGRWHADIEGLLGRRPELVCFPLFLPPGRPTTSADVGSPLAPADLPRVADQIVAAHVGGRRISVIDFPLINPLLAMRGYPVGLMGPCDAGRGRFCVQADATLSPCHPSRHVLGHLGPGILKRLRRNPDHARLGLRSFSSCQGCAWLDLCGHCRAVVSGRGFPLFDDDGWCSALECKRPLRHDSS